MTPEQEQHLKEVTAEAFGVDVDEIDDKTSPQTLAAWTSFSHLTLMSAVEEAFGLTFSMEEMTGVHNFSELRQTVAPHV